MSICNPGDIIGMTAIDGGVSRDSQVWSCAWEDCDVFFIGIDYLKYMWDMLKKFKNTKQMVTLLNLHPIFNSLTEQT